MSVSDKLTAIATNINAEIERANETTGESDTDLHEAVGTLIDGYGQGGGIELNNVTWHQCPTAVKNYLDNVTYDPNDYTTSEIATYAPGTAVVSNTKPIGKTVEGVTYYNNIPNTETDYVGETQCGYVKPLDSLRWLNTVTDNVRDLGGWACDGGTVKYGKLFRGAEINESDKNLLVNQVGIRRQLNLRGSETSDIVSPLGEGIYFYKPPTFTQYTLNNTYMKETLEFIFDGIMRNEPIYFHCHYGADRTGTLACIVESLLGMSQSDIDKDYEITSFYSGTWHDNVARRRNEAEWTGFINQIKAVSLMEGLTDSFRNRVISYVVSLGFTIADLDDFRQLMIDGNPEPIVPVPAYTNVFVPAAATLNARLNSSGTTTAINGSVVTDFIDVHECPKAGNFYIYFKNIADIMTRTGQVVYAQSYSENKELISSVQDVIYANISTEYGKSKIYQFPNSFWANAYYIRYSFFPRGNTTALTSDDISDIIMTLNEEIV